MEPHGRTVPIGEALVTDQQDAPAHSHARPSRSRWWLVLVVVLVVVAFVAAGVGGVVYGRQTAPGPDIVVQPEPVVEESPAVEPMAVGSLPGGPTAPSPESAGLGALDITVGGSPSAPAVILTAAPGLPDTPTTATGFRLVNAGINGAQVAAVLGATFGAAGTPVQSDAGWVVGSPGGPVLTVSDDPLFSWTFEDPPALARPVVGEQLDPGSAISLATALLSGIGVDTGSVEWQVDRYADFTAVTAWQVVAGERSQLSWQLAFNPDGGVVRASGFSAGLEPVPGYPVVGAATAVNRSVQPPWSAVPATLIDVPAADQTADGAATPSSSPSSSSADRPAVEVTVAEATVTDAILGLAQYWQPDGSVLMLPSYVLTADDGSRWSLLAVSDADVSFVPPTYPSATP
jgi:hypothetical protein